MQLVLRKLAQIVERGQVHEPVTPTTIRLNQRGEPEIGSRASTASGDTWIISTPRYSAPELLSSRGSLEPAQQAKATLYAVGMVFYEILVGSENYRRLVRDVLDKNTDLAWLAWQTDSNLRLPRLDTVLPGVPAELANLFEQLLEKDPARRMRGFGEAEAQVNRLLQRTLPTEQFEAPAKVEAQAVKASVPSARRNELAIIAATAIALIALVFLIRLALR
jgi:serine/threonine protein kinase